MDGSQVKAPEVQALWFVASTWSRTAAAEWCADHDFEPVAWRERRDQSEVLTHHIAVIFQPDEADPDSYRTLSDDFPEGISATLAERKDMPRHIVKTGTQSESDPWVFVMSTEDVDRDGDIIEQAGIDLRDFNKNPIALFAHDHKNPIGVWENVRREGKRLVGHLKLAALGTSDFIDTLHKLIEQRILRAVSIGFMASEYEPMEKGGLRFKKTSLLECSLVAVPANQNALRSKAKQLIPDELEPVFLQANTDEGRSERARQAGDKATRQKSARQGLDHNETSTKGNPMSIADKIAAKQERLVAVKDRLTELKQLVEDADEDLDQEQQDEIDALGDEQEKLIKSIESLQKIEAGLAAKAQPIKSTGTTGKPGTANVRAPAQAAAKEPGGNLLVKTMAASLIAKFSDRPVSEVLDEVYSEDDRVKAVSKAYLGRKSTVDAADTTTAGWAAELVQNDLRGFMEDLRAVSVYAQLANLGRALDFGTANSITIPRRDRSAQNGGAEMGGSWVGEGGVIPVKQMAIASQTLNRYKLAVISAFTNELMQQSVPNIEGIIRDAILEDTALVIDGALMDASAVVPGVRPAGLLNGVTLTASAGATAGDIVTDIKVLLAAMSSINGARPVLIMNSNRLLGLSTVTTAAGGFMFRDEIAQGRLLGVPVVTSTTVAANTVMIVDAGSFVGANAVPAFSISDQAALVMANADATAPTQADDGAGALGTAEQVPADGGIRLAGDTGAAGTGMIAQSMWQQYQTAVRMILPSSWGLIRTGAVAGLSGVNW